MVREIRSGAVRIVTVIVVVALFVVGLGLLAMVVGPPVIANLSGGVSDGTPVELRDDDRHVSVIPPEGWVVSRTPWEEDRMRFTSPDRVLTVELSLSTDSAESAFDTLAAAAQADDVQLSTGHVETLASGRPVIHADAGMDGLIAAVGVDEGSVTVVATTREGTDAAPYRPAIAEVLEGIGARP